MISIVSSVSTSVVNGKYWLCMASKCRDSRYDRGERTDHGMQLGKISDSPHQITTGKGDQKACPYKSKGK